MSWKLKTFQTQPMFGFSTKSGFSLIEAIVVIAILGLLSVIAIPAFLGYKAETEKKELLSKVNSFYAAVSVCLMDDEISNCNSKLALGFYCPTGCSQVTAGMADPSMATDPLDRLSILININDSKACASYTDMAVKNLLMKGVCHVTATSMALLPFKTCKANADCGSGNTCYSSTVTLDSSTKLCAGTP